MTTRAAPPNDTGEAEQLHEFPPPTTEYISDSMEGAVMNAWVWLRALPVGSGYQHKHTHYPTRAASHGDNLRC